MTTYGHANLYLKDQWQLMGVLDALNGMLLFGLTPAFLFAMIQRAWPLGSTERHREPKLRNSRRRKFVWCILLLLNHKHEKTDLLPSLGSR